MTAPWLQALQARADEPPALPRQALHVALHGAAIGSIEPALAHALVAAGAPIAPHGEGWCIAGLPVDDALARTAELLRTLGRAGAWRDELLTVADADGVAVGAIERAAVRPLGIATQAVHLVGWAAQGGMWVQQRALDKSTDPGLWDTLMGGLVSAGESTATTLARETWEEAGLQVEALREVRARRPLAVRRPVRTGYMIEHIHVYEAVVPDGLVPVNQDGEVALFERLTGAELSHRLEAGAFTLEAALILADALAAANRG